ncbi:hypothetical protein L0F51_04135 [Afifella sp. H1R]|uniref:hypothetical protein n=1 Tax=Afifella sp. H1R TaxID=2908841 RepID=UPI001F1EFC4D|nr:hypothetical protein [Afifella sp. H1R]MCF1502954.1 hypothetical protein [Afifella sp. H1R]
MAEKNVKGGKTATEADWRPIETAPCDGTPIQARIPGHGEDNIIAWMDGFLDEHERPCCSWVMVEDQEPPKSWTDGVCWEANEDETASVQPTHWRPRPESAVASTTQETSDA